MYNVEVKRNNDICCCDAFPSTCFDNLDGFSKDTCDPLCDPYFVLSFTECQAISPCPETVTTDVSIDSATTTNVNYEFYFNVNSSAIEPVWVWVFACDHTSLFINNYYFYSVLFICLMLVNGYWGVGCKFLYSSKFPFNNNPFITPITMAVYILKDLHYILVYKRWVPSFLL